MRLIDEDAVKRRMHETMDYQDLYLPVHFEMCMNDAPTVEPVSPWHRVEERLPDDSRDVIIFTASRIIGVGSFIRPNWYQWYSGGGLPVDVTHWMPLPEPPKEEEHGN